MYRRNWRLGLIGIAGLCGLVALAGCGGAAQADKHTATSTAPTPTAASAVASPTAPVATGRVCRTIRPKLLHSVLKAPVEKLGYGREDLAVCGSADTVTFEFGYSIVPGPTTLPALGDHVTAVPGLGHDARLDSDEFSQTLWARRGKVVFMVRNDTVENADPISLATSKKVLTQLIHGATAAQTAATPKIRVPRACPAASAAEVTTVAGPILTARGTDNADSIDCQYLGSGGTRLDVGVFRQADAERDFVQQHQQDPGIAPATIAGARQAYLSTDDPTYLQLYFSTSADTAWSIDATALVGGRDYQAGHVPGTVAAVKRLATSFVAATPAFR